MLKEIFIGSTFVEKYFSCSKVYYRINVALAVLQPYRDLEAGDNQSLKFKWLDSESNPGPLAPIIGH